MTYWAHVSFTIVTPPNFWMLYQHENKIVAWCCFNWISFTWTINLQVFPVKYLFIYLVYFKSRFQFFFFEILRNFSNIPKITVYGKSCRHLPITWRFIFVYSNSFYLYKMTLQIFHTPSSNFWALCKSVILNMWHIIPLGVELVFPWGCLSGHIRHLHYNS